MVQSDSNKTLGILGGNVTAAFYTSQPGNN
jgi:hypothetical protein